MPLDLSLLPVNTPPKPKTRVVREQVLDARLCLLRSCPKLQSEIHSSGHPVYRCGAGVFNANLPQDGLKQEIARNPSPVPGAASQDNPFLLRLLMSRDCVRPECGVSEVQYTEKVLGSEPEDEELFRS